MADIEDLIRRSAGPDRNGVSFEAVHQRSTALRRRKTIRTAAAAGALSASLVVGGLFFVRSVDDGDSVISTTSELSEAELADLAIVEDLDSNERALFDAIRDGDVTAVQSLLDGDDVDIEARSPNGLLSPLMVASFRGDTEMVQVLLDGGADVAARGQSGSTSVEVAARAGARDTWLLLATAAPVPQEVLDRSLLAAVLSSNPDMVDEVVEAGAALSNVGGDALLLALEDTPSAAVIATLVAAGVDPDVPATSGEIPRDVAEAIGDDQLIAALG